MSSAWDNIRPAPKDHPIFREPLRVFTVGSPGSIKFSLADMAGETQPEPVAPESTETDEVTDA